MNPADIAEYRQRLTWDKQRPRAANMPWWWEALERSLGEVERLQGLVADSHELNAERIGDLDAWKLTCTGCAWEAHVACDAGELLGSGGVLRARGEAHVADLLRGPQ